MANPSTKTNVADIINTLFQEQNNVMDFGNKLIQDKVQSDLVYRKAQIESDFNKQMNSLSQRGDYDNFEKDTNAFLNNYRTKLQKESRIPLEARYVDEMFLGYKNAMEQNVARLSMQKTANATVANYENSIKVNSDTYAGQQAIDANLEPISRLQANAMIDYGDAQEKRLRTSESSILKEHTEYIDSVVDDIVSNGISKEDFIRNYLEYANNQKYQVLFLDTAHSSPEGFIEAIKTGNGYFDISDKINYSAIGEAAQTHLQKSYAKAVDSFQDKNKEILVNGIERLLRSTANETEQELLKTEGRGILNQLVKNPNALKVSDIEHFRSMFAPKEGSGGKTGGLNKAENDCWNILDGYFAGVKNGENSRLLGIKTGHDFYNVAFNHVEEVAKTYGLNADQTELLRTKMFDRYTDKFKSFYSSDSRTASAYEKIHVMAKEYGKSGNLSEKELEKNLVASMYDALADTDISNPAQIEIALNRIYRETIGQQTNILQEKSKGKEDSTKFNDKYVDKKTGEIKNLEDCIGEGVFSLSYGKDIKGKTTESKIVYSDIRGATVISPTAEKAVDTIDNAIRQELAKYYYTKDNIENISVVANWKSDGKNDYTGTRIYTVTKPDGKTIDIEFIPTEKGAFGKYHFDVVENGKIITNDKELAKMKAPKSEKPSIPMKSVQEAAEEAGYSTENLTARNITPTEPDTRGGKNKAPNTLDLTDAGLLKAEDKKEPLGEIIGVSTGKNETKKPEETKPLNSFTPKQFY